MSGNLHSASRRLVTALVLLGSTLHAQSTSPPASTASEKAVVLDSFTVKSTGDDGYRTRSSASGSINWQNVTNEQYRDRRAYFVTPSTLTLTEDLRF